MEKRELKYIIDVREFIKLARLHLRENIDIDSIVIDSGVSKNSINTWERNAPKSVVLVYYLMDRFGLSFNEIVYLVEDKLIIDLRKALLIVEVKTGERVKIREISEVINIAGQSNLVWKKEAPKGIYFLSYVFKKYPFAKIKDLVKEV